MAARETTSKRGQRAEQIACDYLRGQGYELLKTNHRCQGGEVDIIAMDHAVLCFVEVRARSSTEFGDPLETISPAKIRRIALAARDYLDTLEGAWPEMRFDAIGIVLSEPPTLTLLRGAFEVTDGY